MLKSGRLRDAVPKLRRDGKEVQGCMSPSSTSFWGKARPRISTKSSRSAPRLSSAVPRARLIWFICWWRAWIWSCILWQWLWIRPKKSSTSDGSTIWTTCVLRRSPPICPRTMPCWMTSVLECECARRALCRGLTNETWCPHWVVYPMLSSGGLTTPNGDRVRDDLMWPLERPIGSLRIQAHLCRTAASSIRVLLECNWNRLARWFGQRPAGTYQRLMIQWRKARNCWKDRLRSPVKRIPTVNVEAQAALELAMPLQLFLDQEVLHDAYGGTRLPGQWKKKMNVDSSHVKIASCDMYVLKNVMKLRHATWTWRGVDTCRRFTWSLNRRYSMRQK